MRRGDRIKPRLQRLEGFDEGFGVRANAGKFLQGRHHIESGGVAVGVVSLRQRARFLALSPARNERNQLEQRIRRGRERYFVGQYLAQRLASHGGGVRSAEQGNDLVDMAEIIACENSEGVADDVVEAAAGKVEIDVPGFLFRSGLVEQAPRQERRRRRIVARTARLRGDRRRRCGGRGRRAGCGRRRFFQLLVQRLQHPGGFLAAGHAQIQARFRLARDGLGIVVAVIAALAAILLRHRRHHAPAHRASFGELHAVGDRHGLVVPGRLAVVTVARGPLHHGGALLRRQRRRDHPSTAARRRSRSATSAAPRKTARSRG